MLPKTGNKILGTSNTYLQLIQAFPPRKIKSESELDTIQNIIDHLLDQENLNEDERDYLHLLGLLVSEYENKFYNIPDIYGIDLLKVLIEERGVNQQELISIFRDEMTLNRVLEKQEEMSLEQIEKLAQLFKVSPDVFLRKVY